MKEEEAITTISKSSFQIWLSCLFCILILFHIWILLTTIKNRNEQSLALFHSSSMIMLCVLGLVLMMSTFILYVWLCQPYDNDNDVNDLLFCLLRDPFILIPLTMMGNLILTRLWKIWTVLMPILLTGTNNATPNTANANTTTTSTTACSSRMKNIYRIINDVIIRSLTYLSGEWIATSTIMKRMKIPRKCCKRNNNNNKKKSNNNKESDNKRFTMLVMMLSIPQIMLQIIRIIIISIISKRNNCNNNNNNDYDDYDDYYYDIDTVTETEDDDINCNECWSHHWTTILGILFTIIPYVITGMFLISINVIDKKKLPALLVEYKSSSSIILQNICLILFVAVPPTVLLLPLSSSSESPSSSQQQVDDETMQDNNNISDAAIYLQCVIIVSIDVSIIVRIVFSRLIKVWSKEEVVVSNLVQTHSADIVQTRNYSNNDMIALANLALAESQIYEEAGLIQKGIDLINTTLGMYKFERNRHSKELIGGFTQNELDMLTLEDLNKIIQLGLRKGKLSRALLSTSKESNEWAEDAFSCYMDTLLIFENCPEAINLDDRSIVFPIFSGLFLDLKSGKIKQDENCTMEQELVSKFVRETKSHGDDVHYTRALAMQAEVNARLGKFREAIETVEVLTTIYVHDEHSTAICKAYGSDRCAQAISISILWKDHIGLKDEALETSNYVIQELLPKMDPSNVHNSGVLLWPIMRFAYRDRAKEMKRLFQTYVVDNFYNFFKSNDAKTPLLPVYKPLLALLTILENVQDGTNIKEVEFRELVRWLEEGENGVAPEFMDGAMINFGWTPFSITAELCLLLSKRLKEDDPSRLKLLEKAKDLAKRSHKKMVDDKGNVKAPIPYETIRSVCDGLDLDLFSEPIPEESLSSLLTASFMPKNMMNSLTSWTKGSSASMKGSSASVDFTGSVTKSPTKNDRSHKSMESFGEESSHHSTKIDH